MLYSGPTGVDSTTRKEADGLSGKLETDLAECAEGDGVRAVAFVSKLFAVKRGSLPRVKGTEKEREREKRRKAENAKLTLNGDANPALPTDESAALIEPKIAVEEAEEEDPESEVLLGFARLYSGTLSLPSVSSPQSSSPAIFLLLPKYNPTLPRTHPKNKSYVHGPITLTGLYEMMGRELVPVEKVRAGSVCAIEAKGLDGDVDGREGEGAGVGGVARGGTLVQEGKDGDDEWVNLAGVGSGVAPIVRVALEPQEPGE